MIKRVVAPSQTSDANHVQHGMLVLTAPTLAEKKSIVKLCVRCWEFIHSFKHAILQFYIAINIEDKT